jgi:DNA-binding response OmpR family regulator
MNERKRILIVEDQADLRKLVTLTLGATRYELLEAADAAQALEAVRGAPPDLVLLDVMLPGGMDGLEVCRRIKADARLDGTIVVMMTASDQAEQRARVRAAGADHYVAKPFSPRELRSLLESLLAEPRAQA